MTSNVMKLNKDKIEFIIFSSKQQVKKPVNFSIKVVSGCNTSFTSLINLEHILDNTLGLQK